MDKVEVGSKWVALSDRPQSAGILKGAVVSVTNATDDEIEYLDETPKESKNGLFWYATPSQWHFYFKPYVGSKWKALVDEPWSAAVYMDEQVTVTYADPKTGSLIFKDGRNEFWRGNLGVWEMYFEPVDEGLDYLDYPDIDDTGNIVDNVNSPSHYGQGKIEAIEYIKDSLTKEEYIGYLRGNIAKYLHRWRYKNGLEDLKKAQWYLERLIEEVE